MRKTIIALSVLATMGVTPAAHASPATYSPVQGLTLSKHNVVQASSLPTCDFTEGAGVVPCAYIPRSSLNNMRLSYWVGKKRNMHYVWSQSPVTRTNGWHWVPSSLSDALAESDLPRATRDWTKCVVNYVPKMRIRCANGSHFSE